MPVTFNWPDSTPEADQAKPETVTPEQDAKGPVTMGFGPKDVDYSQVPMTEVAKQAIANLPESAWRNIKAIPEAVYNYPQTIEGIKQLGAGAYSKAAGALGVKQDPEQKARTEAVLNEALRPYTSAAGFKEALANDPFSVLSTIAIPVTGGAATLGKTAQILGEAGTLGKIAGTTAKIAKTAGLAMDPTQAAISTAGKVLEYGGKGAKAGISAATSVPESAYRGAFKAGEAASEKSPEFANVFNTYAKGEGDPVDLSMRVRNAIAKEQQANMDVWGKSKEAMMGAASKDVPFNYIQSSINKELEKLGPVGSPTTFDPAAHDVLQQIQGTIDQMAKYPSGDFNRTLAGFDNLKQNLYSLAKQQPNDRAYNAVMGVYNGVKQSIGQVAPEYQRLMEGYQMMNSEMQNFQKSLGATSRTAANAQLAKMMRAQKTPYGQDLLDRLAVHDPSIPYAVAGATLHDATPGGLAALFEGGGALTNIGAGGYHLATGNPKMAALHFAAIPAQLTVQSPYAMGKGAYYSGRIAGTPVAKGINAGVGAARQATRVDPFMEQLQKASEQAQTDQESEPLQVTIPYPKQQADGGRIARKAGGRIKSAQSEAEALMKAAESAKKGISKTTEALLDQPDEHIAKALEIAKQHI